jgi:hypothetical protein
MNGAFMDAVTLAALAEFPRRLEAVTVRGLVHNLCSHDQQHLAGLQWLLARIAAGTP